MKAAFLFYLGLFPKALTLFLQNNPVKILFAFFIFFVVPLLPNIIPILGNIVSLILQAIVIMGIWAFLIRIVDGKEAPLSLLFDYAKHWLPATLAQLVAVLATFFAVGIVLVLIAAMGAGLGEGGIWLAMLFSPLVVVAIMLFFFWPAFAVDKERKPFDALGDSASMVVKNIPALLALLVVGFGVSLVTLLLVAIFGQVSPILATIFSFVWSLMVGPTVLLMVAMIYRHLNPPSATASTADCCQVNDLNEE